MAKKNRQPNRGGGGSSGNIWYRRFLDVMCFIGGYIPEDKTPTSTLKAIIAKVQDSQGDYEHSVPDQRSEILRYVLKANGADENEIRQAIDELIPANVMASVEGVSVETVRENRQQVKEARKQYGMFSKEAKAARKDLRQDRRASRRARRRAGGGFNWGQAATNAASIVGALA